MAAPFYGSITATGAVSVGSTLSVTGASTFAGAVTSTAPAASAGTTTQSSQTHVFQTNYWNGSTSVTETSVIQDVRTSTAAGGHVLAVTAPAVTFSGYLDLSSVTTTNVGAGTGVGDKITLYTNIYGFGIQSGRLVAFVPTAGAFSVRAYSATGAASSGTDAITLFPNGTATFTGAITGTAASLSSTLSVTGLTSFAGPVQGTVVSATAGTTQVNGQTWQFSTSYWNGSTAVTESASLSAIRSSAAANGYYLYFAAPQASFSGSVQVGTLLAVTGGLTVGGTSTLSGTLSTASGVGMYSGDRLTVDNNSLNTGAALTPGVQLGAGSGEGISSARTAVGTNAPTNQNGLDVWTNNTKRLQLYQNGQFHVAPSGTATSGTTTYNSNGIYFDSTYWNGSASVTTPNDAIYSRRTGTNAAGTRLHFDAATAYEWYVAGAIAAQLNATQLILSTGLQVASTGGIFNTDDLSWGANYSFGTGWNSYNFVGSTTTFYDVQVRLRGGVEKMVEFRGLIQTTATVTPGGTNQTLFTLPAAYRPARQVILNMLLQNTTACRVDVFPSGVVQLISVLGNATIPSGTFMSLDNVRFSIAAN